QRNLRHAKVVEQAVVEHAERRFEVGSGEQGKGRAMQLLADGIVFAAELDEFLQLGFQLQVLLAQGDDLALGDGNRTASVRMRHEDLGEQIRVLLEEARVLLQIVGDRARIHLTIPVHGHHCSGTLHSPSNTVCAGPVIITGAASPPQAIVNVPPRVATRTGESSRSRRIPATTAAQAPVPHESVSPAPRSHTRKRMLARSTTCMKPALTPRGKRACVSIRGPCVASGAASRSSTTWTACG